MYQSSPRKNFSDTLLDFNGIGLLSSILLHAIIGVNLPFFSHTDKEPKKAEPGTVKIVELTPGELQRIPQAPPIPAPKVLAPTTPTPNQVAKPQGIPPISPNSPTIPFSPIRIPLEKVNPKPSPGNVTQKSIPQKQSTAPVVDAKISAKPNPKPSSSTPKTSTKPNPSPIPKITPKILAKPDPSSTAVLDDDGGDTPPSSANPTNSQAQSPVVTTPAAGTPVATTVPNQPSGTPGDDGSSFPPFYGKHAAAALERLKQYETAYPGIVKYKLITLTQSYPVGTLCPKVKQTPFIVLMAAFDKVPENTENDPLGDATAPSIDKPYVAADQDTPENRKLAEIAVNTAIYDANKADQNRPVADKGKRVLYQYRVQFDQSTCKK